MASKLIPKQRVLIANETPSSLDNWRESMIFHIVIEPKFARFADQADLGIFGKSSVKNRGFTNG